MDIVSMAVPLSGDRINEYISDSNFHGAKFLDQLK